MGIIQRQSIRSTVIIVIGFSIGAFNLIILQPKILTANEFGLTRIITDAGLTLASLCTLGCIPVIYKFYPIYRSKLNTSKNDLPFFTFVVCMIGFVLVCIVGYFLRDLIIQKFSARSPLFVEYSYLVYPFSFFMLLFIWLESFAWSMKKGVESNILKEGVTRIFFTLILCILAFKVVEVPSFLLLFSLSYLIPAISLFLILKNTGDFSFNAVTSSVTNRYKGKMFSFGIFVFGAQFLNLLSKTADTFILSARSSGGLRDAAVFTIATYMITLMEIPQRSMNTITIPVLAESWKNKDLGNIKHIYVKSVNNLLVIGLGMFAVLSLNIHNLALYLGTDFTGVEMVVLVIGIGKLLDLSTGVNGQIIGTSSYWKTDFITNVIYTLIALPLNYILIGKYGLIGAAYSSLISLTFYNVMRFGFLWIVFKLQPYNIKHLYAILITIVCGIIAYSIPTNTNIIADACLRTFVFLVLFVPAVYFSKASIELNELMLSYLQKLKLKK